MGAPVAVRHLSPQRYHADASSMCAPMLVSPSAAAKVRYARYKRGFMAALQRRIRIMVSVVPSSKCVTAADCRPYGGRGDVA